MEGPPKYMPPESASPEASQVEKYRQLFESSRVRHTKSDTYFVSKVLDQLRAEMVGAPDQVAAIQAQVAFLLAFSELPIPDEVKSQLLHHQLRSILTLPNCISVKAAYELVFSPAEV